MLVRFYTATVVLAAVVGLGLAAPPAQALSLTLNSGGTGSLGTLASDASGGSVSEWVGHSVVPYSYSSTSHDGGASSSATYDISDTGFIITLNQLRPSTTSSLSQAGGDIFFSTDQSATFDALGSYFVTDSAGRRVYFRAFLYNVTTSSYVFDRYQESRSTPNEAFSLVTSGGDYANGSVGSLSGVLTAGHSYRYYYNVFTQANVTGGSSASASGTLFLNITPVPEPGTGVLLGVGLAGLAAASKRRVRR